jgi:hypothetical protein
LTSPYQNTQDATREAPLAEPPESLVTLNRSLSLVSALFCTVLLAASAAHALPRYSATYGQNCGLCHQDPTGGGLRTLYASQFLVPTELAATAPELETISPLIAERIMFGVDLRTLFSNAEERDAVRLQMQSELHLAIIADEHLSIQIDLGQGGAQEAFGLAYVLPAHGWVKAGRFTPNYGWKFADHQLFARYYNLDSAGTRSPREWESTGLEVGLVPGPLQITGSVDEGGDGGESWTMSVVWRVSHGPLNLALGGSFLRRELIESHRRSVGVHGAIQWSRLSWLGQWDEPRQADRRERVLTQELVAVVSRGINLRMVHGFYDPDRDFETGRRQRVGGGVDYFVTPFFGTLAMVNYDADDRGTDERYGGGWSADLVLHFLY